MKYIGVVLMLALTGGVASADELLLTDGRKVAWKSIADQGDSYAIETKDGQKLTIKKADVEKFVVDRPPAAPPLTGASFTMDPKKAVTTDLIPKAEVDPKDPGAKWKLAGKALVGAGAWPTRSVLLFDYELPEEYDLSLVVERVGNGNKDFAVGIAAGNALCAFHFDAWDATKSVLALVAGGEGEAVAGQVFRPGKPRVVKVMVRKDDLGVQLDGKDFWKGRVDWKQVTPHQAVIVRSKGKPFLVAAGGDWKVSAFSVIHVKP